MPNGSELFVEATLKLGIRQIFTLVGDHLNDVLPLAARSGIRIIDMRHESGVTHMADAWARITRQPSLSLVTGGGGHTNSLTGIATAFLAGSPLISVSGSRTSTVAQRQGFQDIDQVGMVRPVVKWAAEPPNAAQIPFYLGRAYREANTGRKGPVHLTIPADLFSAKTDAPTTVPVPPDEHPATPASCDIERAIALLKSAQRPIVIAGSGVWWSRAEVELRAFIEHTSLPLYTITMGRGVVPDSHPLNLGYADPALNRAANSAFHEADLFLVIGKRVDYRLALGSARLFPPEAKFIQVDIHPQELGMNHKLDVAICGDAKATLLGLNSAAGEKPWTPLPWLHHLRKLRADWEAHLATTAGDRSTPIHPSAFFRELRAALPPGIIYSWDGGDFAHWGRASLPIDEPGKWLRLGPLASIGAALPNGLAMQLAYPGKPVTVITGDGSLGFYIAELDTAVRHKLPVVVIVGNDSGWGLERELQRGVTGLAETAACELRPTRYDVVMKGFGGEGELIESLDQVHPAVERAFAAGVPYLLNVAIRGVRSPFTEWQVASKQNVRSERA